MLRLLKTNSSPLLSVMALCSLLLCSTAARATDLGMTPSHVFGLWTSINATLTRLLEVEGVSEANRDQANNLNASRFSSKKPADVYEQVSAFREKANRLISRNGAASIDTRTNAPGSKITPSQVFLSSGNVLDGLVILLISKTDNTEHISQYYKNNKFSGKTPSDVYGLVDLANRRMAFLKN